MGIHVTTREQQINNGENSQVERNNQRQIQTSERDETVDESGAIGRYGKLNGD